MGVEYARWLVPDSPVRPTPTQLAHLVWALGEADYLPRNDERARVLRGVVITRDGLAVLRKKPATRERPAYREFCLGPFAPTPEHIAALPKPLSFRWPIDAVVTPGDRVGYLRYPLTVLPDTDEISYSLELVVADSVEALEDDFLLPEDLAVPFFLMVDCGKCFAAAEDQAFAPPLRALVERIVGVSFREIEQYY
ncbi:MAG: hypothetical protein ACXVEE_42405 [Polyangiales bacterium]